MGIMRRRVKPEKPRLHIHKTSDGRTIVLGCEAPLVKNSFERWWKKYSHELKRALGKTLL